MTCMEETHGKELFDCASDSYFRSSKSGTYIECQSICAKSFLLLRSTVYTPYNSTCRVNKDRRRRNVSGADAMTQSVHCQPVATRSTCGRGSFPVLWADGVPGAYSFPPHIRGNAHHLPWLIYSGFRVYWSIQPSGVPVGPSFRADSVSSHAVYLAFVHGSL